MVKRKREFSALWLAVSLIWTLLPFDIARASSTLFVAPDSQVTYSRALFKHWIDEDKDGCDTRAEVLIEEATVKPKVGKKCAITGGSWLSPYDNKVQSKASSLDIDHLVPLAEAWRSGAWKWTTLQRQSFANDLSNPKALVAVTLRVNRQKGDRDVSSWLPQVGQCEYIRDWIEIKLQYSLSVDPLEGQFLEQRVKTCSIQGVTLVNEESKSPAPTVSPSTSTVPSPIASPSATPSISSSQTPVASPTPTPTSSPARSPSPTSSIRVISPGAFCSQSEAGQQGQNSKGVIYTCKVSDSENRLRWRL